MNLPESELFIKMLTCKLKWKDCRNFRFSVWPLLLAMALTGYSQTLVPERVGVGPAQKKLSLQEAIETALTSNLEIEIEKSNTALAQQAVKAARGFYDPTFRWLPGIESRNTPVASVLQGSDGILTEHLNSQNLYFRQKLPWAGSAFNVDFENGRQSTTNPFTSLNPFLTSRFFVTFNQPLLRNREIDSERVELKVRRKQLDISDTEFEMKVMDVIHRVERAYWDLVAARKDVEVKADSVKWAQEQLAQNQRMINAGMLAPVELAASKAELERRIDTWYSSVGWLTEVENLLKALLSENRGGELWKEEIVPIDDRTLDSPETKELDELVTQAIRQRPEIRLISQRQQTNEIQKQYHANQTKPQVNLVASYGSNGLGGSLFVQNDPFTSSFAGLYQRLNQLSESAGLPPVSPPNFGGVPGSLVGGYGTALSNLFSGRFKSLLVGLNFDLNFRNRAAQANFSQSVISEKRLRLEQASIEQIIEVQVRNALQSVQTARQRIKAADASTRAAQEKFESETRLFQTGESTNFLVLTRQNELADSRHRLVVANLDFNKAIAELEQALGTTLIAHKIALK